MFAPLSGEVSLHMDAPPEKVWALVSDMPLAASLGAALLVLLPWVEKSDEQTRKSLPAFGALLGLATLAVVAAGMLGRRGGYALGWAVQVVTLALGFVVPMMFVLGIVFGSLWAGAYFLGIKVDREKAERAVLEEEWQAENG